MAIRGIGEIILYVQDMPRQVAFYRDVLGLPLLYADSPHDLGAAYWVVFDAGECKLALHGGGACRMAEDSPKIVYMVDDIETERNRLLRIGHEREEAEDGQTNKRRKQWQRTGQQSSQRPRGLQSWQTSVKTHISNRRTPGFAAPCREPGRMPLVRRAPLQ